MILEEKIKAQVLKNTKIRPCDIYDLEYIECKSIKGRFHQYFIHGEFLDCSQWETDYNNCNRWEKYTDHKAYGELLRSERIRMFKRLQAHYGNDVWEKRDKPPDNWNNPLPEWLENRNKYGYLAKKANDIKNGTVNDIDLKFNICSIL